MEIKLDKNNLPKHIAIIMDGNGRWATEQGQDRLFGHYQGVESVRDVVEGCSELGISYLTLYAFSTENWNRPENEVMGLMELLISTIRNEVESLTKNNIRLQVIGNLKMLPDKAQIEMQEAISATKNNTGLTLIMALSYSGRWDIINAVKQLAKEIELNKIDIEDINEATFAQFLTTQHIPDPELMIRTSGEYRISNFLIYQIAYSELYFTPIRWPEFRKQNLYDAIADYQNRERRFGKITEQLTK